MKQLFLIVSAFWCCVVNAQTQNVSIIHTNVAIPVHSDAIGESLNCMIFQDSINEAYYSVTIIEKSPLRFKVNLQLETGLDSAPEIIGWVDKKYCGVFQRWYYERDENDNLVRFVKLYEEPNIDAKFIKIYDVINDPLTVIDFQNRWVKVMFYLDDVLYEGWIDKYCSNPYNSCT